MKKILLIYPYYNQLNLIKNFSSRISDRGFQIDCICYANLADVRHSNIHWPLFIKVLFIVLDTTRNTFLGKCIYAVVARYLKNTIIRRLILNYDLIDFHSYTTAYNPLMKFCVKNQILFDITNWGSDVMRASQRSVELQRYGYEHCRCIKSAESLHIERHHQFMNGFHSKERVLYFGNSDFEEIDQLEDKTVQNIKVKLCGQNTNKLIIVCGYNGSSHQNHIEMIESINVLSKQKKDNIHLVIPMTYGATADYLNEIQSKLNQSGLSYTILNTYLSTEDNAALRRFADIVVNIQDTDALAGSLMDHLYCGNVCIFGEWLNYIPYDRNHVFYLKTSRQALSEKIDYAIEHYWELKEMCVNNHDILKENFSWNKIIDKWTKVYGE